MNTLALVLELTERLRVLPNTQVLEWGADDVRPPTLLVPIPERISFDETYARGADSIDIEWMVLVSRVNLRQATKLLLRYTELEGPYSVKALADSSPGRPWETCDDFQVTSAEPDIVRLAGREFLALIFKGQAFGSGRG